jgi:hypothetical protein
MPDITEIRAWHLGARNALQYTNFRNGKRIASCYINITVFLISLSEFWQRDQCFSSNWQYHWNTSQQAGETFVRNINVKHNLKSSFMYNYNKNFRELENVSLCTCNSERDSLFHLVIKILNQLFKSSTCTWTPEGIWNRNYWILDVHPYWFGRPCFLLYIFHH